MLHYTIRKGVAIDLAQIATLLVKSWRKNYVSFLPAHFLAGMSIEKQIDRHKVYMKEKATYLVAEIAEKNQAQNIIAFASIGKNRDPFLTAKWELYTLYVSNEHHGKGIGKALLSQLLTHISDPENGVAVWVMEENSFRIFYENQGFIQQKKQAIDFGGFEVMNIGYVKHLG